MLRLTSLAILAATSVPLAALANPPDGDAGPRSDYETTGLASGDVRATTRAWLVGPPGWDAGGELRFITSDLGLVDGRALKLTDVGIVRARLRYTASRRIELFGSIDALAKQPSYSDSSPFQGATVGLKVAVSPRWALTAGVSGGPTLGDDGQWGDGATNVVFRSHPDETLSFQVSAGAKATALRFERAPEQWLTEATAGGNVMFHTPNGMWGTWLGANLAVPVVASRALDPNTRLDVTVGSVYAVARDWDVYAEGSIFDRGDAGMAATMLPILDGGFDQRQLVVGVVRRFDRQSSSRRSNDALMIGAR